MRTLASIQKIKDIQPIKDADQIELATVLGWHVVVKKGEFKTGDLCVYFEVDSFLPVIPQFDFLAKSGTKKMLIDKKEVHGYRIKTIRLRGQISQGLALPLGLFADLLKIQDVWEEGTDVTEKLGVYKYEMPMPAQLAGKVRGFFPGFIPKTDETRIQSCPELLERYKDVHFYVTEKLDGTSATFFKKDGELRVCSRNLELLPDENNTLWKLAKKYDLDTQLPDGMALQGEVIGEGIQKNRYKIKGQDFYAFSIFIFDPWTEQDGISGVNYKEGYLDVFDFLHECRNNIGVKTVPIIDKEQMLLPTVDEMVKFATVKSFLNPDIWLEGYVFRPLEEMIDPDLGRLSFKVINPEFLLKYEQ